MTLIATSPLRPKLQSSRWLPLLLAAVALLLGGCALRPLLSETSVAPSVISPNADGFDDVAEIRYHVGRPSSVSIYFVDAAGRRHHFREAQRRSPGDYDVYWGGVINSPETRSTAGGNMLLESQVLPDGDY